MEEQEFEQLEKYLLNQMTAEEEALYEKKLAEDKPLQEIARQFQTLFIGLEEAGRLRLMNQLKEEDALVGAKVMPLYLKIAASIVLVAGLAIGLQQWWQKTPDYNQLATEFYQEADRPQLNLAEVTAEKQMALQQYQSADYQSSLEILQNIESSPKDPDVPLIKGLNLMELQKYTDASDEFQKVLDINGAHVIEGKWYLSLCKLQVGEIDGARRLLDDLAASNSKAYKTKSERLLKELKW